MTNGKEPALLHCEPGFGVYRSTQVGHIPLFLLLYLLVGPSIEHSLRLCKLRGQYALAGMDVR
jgi:hypothetical protein